MKEQQEDRQTKHAPYLKEKNIQKAFFVIFCRTASSSITLFNNILHAKIKVLPIYMCTKQKKTYIAVCASRHVNHVNSDLTSSLRDTTKITAYSVPKATSAHAWFKWMNANRGEVEGMKKCTRGEEELLQWLVERFQEDGCQEDAEEKDKEQMEVDATKEAAAKRLRDTCLLCYDLDLPHPVPLKFEDEEKKGVEYPPDAPRFWYHGVGDKFIFTPTLISQAKRELKEIAGAGLVRFQKGFNQHVDVCRNDDGFQRVILCKNTSSYEFFI
jgi:hypothetical protein